MKSKIKNKRRQFMLEDVKYMASTIDSALVNQIKQD